MILFSLAIIDAVLIERALRKAPWKKYSHASYLVPPACILSFFVVCGLFAVSVGYSPAVLAAFICFGPIVSLFAIMLTDCIFGFEKL